MKDDEGGERPIADVPAAQPGAGARPDADAGAQAPTLGRASAVMSVGTGLSRVTGFVRLSVMAWAIGGTESKLPDTYNLANAMPNMVYQLVIGEVLATLFVPVFVEHLKRRERPEAWTLASTILTLAVIVSGAFALLTVLFAPWIIKMWSFRLPDELARERFEATGTFFLRLFMPQMIFYATGMVLTGLLNAHRKFGPPMFAPILNNLIVIATFVAFKVVHEGRPDLATITTGEKFLLGGGTTLGVIAMTMVLWPSVRRLPGRFSLRALQWRHPAIRHVGNLAKWSFGYVVVNQIGLWVVYAVANRTQGGVTAYQSSWILYQLPYGIFAVSVMTYLVPRMAEHHVDRKPELLARDVSLGLRTTAFIVLPAAAGFIALGEPIVRLLLEHGVFGAESTRLFADTFVFMSVGLAAYTAFQMVMRAFYALQDARTPMLVNVAAVAAQIATAIPLYRALGVPGLGLSHAASYLTGALAGGAILRARLGSLDGRRLADSYARIGIAAATTGVAAWFTSNAVGERVDLDAVGGRLLQVGLAVLAGAASYLAAVLLLRVEEFGRVLQMLPGRFGGRQPAGEQGGIVLGWLLKLLLWFALIGAVLFEAGAVLITKAAADNVAMKAATEAALEYGRSESARQARAHAEQVAARSRARVVGFGVVRDGQDVSVTVEKEAKTLLIHRVDALERFTVARATHRGRVR